MTDAKLPETISKTVEHKGVNYQVELRKHSVRAPGFELYTFDDRRTPQRQLQVDVPEPRTYRGYIANDKSQVVTGFIDAKGELSVTIFGGPPNTQLFSLRIDHIPLDADYSFGASGYAKLGNKDIRDTSIVIPEITNNRLYVPTPGPNFHSYLARVRAHYYSGTFTDEKFANGDVTMALLEIEGAINDIDYSIGRYVGLRHDLAWAQIDLHGNGPEVGGHTHRWPGWNEQGSVETNVSYAFQAFGRGCGTDNRTAASMEPAGGRPSFCMAHEIGHMLTLSHYVPDETIEIMAHHNRFSVMTSQKALKALQTEEMWFTAKPLDPQTSPMLPAPYTDYITVYEGQSGTVRPLDNDFDANGETLSMTAFDAATKEGGTVASLGNGVLRYTPKSGFVGTDFFTYTVQDAGGYLAKQTIHVQVAPKGIAGDWSIDGDTEKVTDKSGYGRDLFVKEGKLVDSLVAGSQGHSLKTAVFASDELVADSLGDKTIPHNFDPGHLSFTASIWFKYGQIDADAGQQQIIVGKATLPKWEDFTMGGWEIVARGHELRMNVAYRDRFAANNWVQLKWPDAIKDGQWHHAVLVIDREAGLVKGYLAGKAHPEPGALPATGAPIRAGWSHKIWGGPMQVGRHTRGPAGSSAWDCLKIYHVALTAGQIQASSCPVK
jgi:hypothetical protein